MAPAPIPLRRRLLLSSDFDDTLVGARDDARHTAAAAAFAAVFPRLRAPCGSGAALVINTGRTLPLFEGHRDAEARLDALGLRPVALVAGVGTRVYWPRRERVGGAEMGGGGSGGGGLGAAAAAPATAEPATDAAAAPSSRWVEDAEWTAAVGAGWQPRAARRAVERALAAAPARANACLRPERELHAHKLTVTLTATRAGAEALCAEIARLSREEHASEEAGGSGSAAAAAAWAAPRFVTGFSAGAADDDDDAAAAGNPGASVGAGAGEGEGEGVYVVDVLPAGAGKCNAMVYVARQLGYVAGELASAGDGHNDETMLSLPAQRRAILVGNAPAGLRARLGTLAHVWAAAPGGTVGAASVLAGLSAGGEEGDDGWFDAAGLLG